MIKRFYEESVRKEGRVGERERFREERGSHVIDASSPQVSCGIWLPPPPIFLQKQDLQFDAWRRRSHRRNSC